jgi:hypothetical protein
VFDCTAGLVLIVRESDVVEGEEMVLVAIKVWVLVRVVVTSAVDVRLSSLNLFQSGCLYQHRSYQRIPPCRASQLNLHTPGIRESRIQADDQSSFLSYTEQDRTHDIKGFCTA